MSAQNASSGFFLDIPYPHKGQSWQDKRASLISELINSERQYAQHLYHFLYEYRVALADAISRNLIMNLPPATEELFGKVEPIYVLNLSFLSNLEKSILCTPNIAWEPAMARIGEVFKHFITGIKNNYSDYAKSFPEGMNALVNQFEVDSNIVHAIQSCQSNVGVNLIECLRSPMERISRYKSLLLMLLEVTPREHNDREDLVSAYINISPMALAYRFFVVHQSYTILQKINSQYSSLGLLNTNIGPLVPGVPSVLMDLKSPSSRYLIFHESEMQCFNGNRVISCQIWLFSDCAMISIPANANPVLFEFKNIKAVQAELPSSFLHSITENENNSTNANIANGSKININLNELSEDNCADFFTNIDSFRVIFLEAKRRDVFIEACSNLRIDMKLDGVDSKMDEQYPLAPVWTNLQDISDCMLCGRTFGIVTQRFHCVYCRKVFCKRCLRHSSTNHAICRNCHKAGLNETVLPHMLINYKVGGFFNGTQQTPAVKKKRTSSQSHQQKQQLPSSQQTTNQQHQPQIPPPLQAKQHLQQPQQPMIYQKQQRLPQQQQQQQQRFPMQPNQQQRFTQQQTNSPIQQSPLQQQQQQRVPQQQQQRLPQQQQQSPSPTQQSSLPSQQQQRYPNQQSRLPSQQPQQQQQQSNIQHRQTVPSQQHPIQPSQQNPLQQHINPQQQQQQQRTNLQQQQIGKAPLQQQQQQQQQRQMPGVQQRSTSMQQPGAPQRQIPGIQPRPGPGISPQGAPGFQGAMMQRQPGVPNPQQVGAKLPQAQQQPQHMVRPVQVQQFQQMQQPKPQTPSPK